MHLTTLYTTEQLSNQIYKKYGTDSLIKVTESKNDDGEEVITVTIVKKMELPQPGELKYFPERHPLETQLFRVLSCDGTTVRAEPFPNTAKPRNSAYCSFHKDDWRKAIDVP